MSFMVTPVLRTIRMRCQISGRVRSVVASLTNTKTFLFNLEELSDHYPQLLSTEDTLSVGTGGGRQG